MKKILVAAALAVSSVLFVGCGGKPKVPANAVAAAYIDVDKAIWNAADVIEMMIGELPKERRKKAEEEFDKFVKEHKKDISALDADWMCATVEPRKNSSSLDLAIVIKCDSKAKLPSVGASLEELAAAALKKVDTINGCDVYAYLESGFGSPLHQFAGCNGMCIAFVDGKYVVCTSVKGFVNDEAKAFANRMIDLYKDGKGDTSDDFGDLADIEDDAVARIQVAEAGTIADILGVRDDIEKFGEEIDDEDLAEMLLDVENVTLDVNLSDDIVGLVLNVDAGSRELAKVVESAFNVLQFASRVWSSVGVAALNDSMNKVLSAFYGSSKKAKGEALKAFGKQAREAVDVDRSGSTATLTVEFDTEDLLEAVVPAMLEGE